MKILSQRETFAHRFTGRIFISYQFTDQEYAQHTADLDRYLDEMRAIDRDSRSMYGRKRPGTERTRWSKERRVAQKQMFNDLYGQWSQGIPQERRALMMGGLGGSGKGTLLRDPAGTGIDTSQYMKIDPDEIKQEMARRGMVPQYDHLSPMEMSALVHEEASNMAQQLAHKAYSEGRNVLWDITMASPDSVLGRINDMRDSGYGTIDAAFADTDMQTARNRAVQRHKDAEERFRGGEVNPHTGEASLGGRWVPEWVSAKNAPAADSAYASKNAEVFGALRHLFDNSVTFDMRGAKPVQSSTTGRRWQPTSYLQAPAFPTAPNRFSGFGGGYLGGGYLGGGPGAGHIGVGAEDQDYFGRQHVARRRRLVAQNIPSVRQLIKDYQEGRIDYQTLFHSLATHDYSDPRPPAQGWDDIFTRAEEPPDDNDYFWIYTANHLGILTDDQEDEIMDAIEANE